MNQIVTKIVNPDPFALMYYEWLVTNGLSGFSAGSLCGAPMRRSHALLIAALPSPFGRTIMLNYVADSILLEDKTEIPLSLICQTSKKCDTESYSLVEFRLENGLPIWVFKIGSILLEKRIFTVHRQNTVHMSYKLLSSDMPLQIRWRPYLHYRGNEQPVNHTNANENYTMHASEHHYEIECLPYPNLRLFCTSSSNPPFTVDSHLLENVYYEIESKRGYESTGNLKSPGYYLAPIEKDHKLTFSASIEPWKAFLVLLPNEALATEKFRRRAILKTAGSVVKSETTAKLVLAAEQFIMIPTNREEDMIRMYAAGEEVRSIIAGFPWFTDWGRDTMISLEGLTLTTGQTKVAYAILRTFAYYIKNGLIPNMFPEGDNKARYNTADATLWFFHAIDRYVQVTKDTDIIEFLLPKLFEIYDQHVNGTKFGIKVDEDGLLVQGQPGVQLTWMDAKVGDWVVTPRRGKAVEINALWYNALRLLEAWSGKTIEHAQRCYESFNKRFWYEEGGYLYDVVDGENGDDSALRPNQLFAISLSYPVLKQERWKPVVEIVQRELLTPVGLRTLSRSHADFKAYYEGDLHARDAAYHQGTVWPWLIGPFIDAWLKVYPDDFKTCGEFLKGLEAHIDTYCVGNVAEIFDASDPYHARGCFAQAWSVAELLRCLVKVNPERS